MQEPIFLMRTSVSRAIFGKAIEQVFRFRPNRMATDAKKGQRLFQREKDNTHEEPLLLAQYALLHLGGILKRPDVSEETLALISDWFQDCLKVRNSVKTA